MSDPKHPVKTQSDTGSDWLWEVDPDGVITYSNGAEEALWGRSSSETIGARLSELVASEDRPKLSCSFQQAASSGSPIRSLLLGFITGDGETRNLETSLVPVRDDAGELKAFRGISRDASHDSTTEDAARELQANYRHLVENSPNGVSIVQNARLVYVNPKMGEQMGYDPREVVGREIWDFVHPDDRGWLTELHMRRMRGEQTPNQYVARGISRSGEVRYFQHYVTLIEYNHAAAVLLNSVDITERRLAEEKLEDEQRLTNSILETLAALVVVLDLEGRIVRFNPACQELTGYRFEEVEGKPLWDFLLAPEEVDSVRQVFSQLTTSGEFGTHHENYWLTRTGERRLIEWSNALIPDASGKVEHVIGTGIDITERRRAEKALRDSEQRLADLISFLPDATFAIDMSSAVIAWNRAMEELTGVAAADAIGLRDYAYAAPLYGSARPILVDLVLQTNEEAEKLYPSLERRDEYLIAETYAPTVGSSGAFLWCKASRLYDREGNVTGAIETIRDITERKLAEENRRILAREMEAQKRQFYRETILSVTEGKLDIQDRPMVRAFLSAAGQKMSVNDTSQVAMARHQMQRYCEDNGLSGDRLHAFMVGVGEAITNAVKHGTQVTVASGATDDSVWVGVSDRGKGIESLVLPKATLRRGFSTKPSMGLGYSIMLEVADRILLNTGRRGTIIVLMKELREPMLHTSTAELPDTWDNIA